MRDGRTPACASGARQWSVVVLAVVWGAFVLAFPEPARAQNDTSDEFWPEIDAFVRMNERSRLMFLASQQRDHDTGYRQSAVGAHIDYYAKPFARKWLETNPDAVKQHYLTFRAGYRYYWDIGDGGGGAHENRILVEGTARFSMHRFFFLNRNRVEWRDQNGTDSWRYRNRSRLEDDISLGSHTTTPYAMAEFFYDGKYDDLDEERYYGGVDWPIGSKAIVDTYYCRQNNTHSHQDVNAFGLTVRVYF